MFAILLSQASWHDPVLCSFCRFLPQFLRPFPHGHFLGLGVLHRQPIGIAAGILHVAHHRDTGRSTDRQDISGRETLVVVLDGQELAMSSRLALTRGVEETRATGSASAEGEWAPRRDLVPTLPRGNATSDALRPPRLTLTYRAPNGDAMRPGGNSEGIAGLVRYWQDG